MEIYDNSELMLWHDQASVLRQSKRKKKKKRPCRETTKKRFQVRVQSFGMLESGFVAMSCPFYGQAQDGATHASAFFVKVCRHPGS